MQEHAERLGKCGRRANQHVQANPREEARTTLREARGGSQAIGGENTTNAPRFLHRAAASRARWLQAASLCCRQRLRPHQPRARRADAPGTARRRGRPRQPDHGSPAPAAGSKRLRRSSRWSHSTIKRRLCNGARSGVGVRTWALDCREPQKGGPRSAALGPDAQRSPHLPVLARDRRGHQGRILFLTNLPGAEKFSQVPRSLGPEQSDIQGPWTHGAERPSGWSVGQFGGS